jgi:glutamate N-acetyltransferase/amino-acid N-acetyltransferase
LGPDRHGRRQIRRRGGPRPLTIRFGDVLVAEKGWVAETYREADGAAYMKRDELAIGGRPWPWGAGAATVWTCDLTHGYIDINADYRS